MIGVGRNRNRTSNDWRWFWSGHGGCCDGRDRRRGRRRHVVLFDRNEQGSVVVEQLFHRSFRHRRRDLGVARVSGKRRCRRWFFWGGLQGNLRRWLGRGLCGCTRYERPNFVDEHLSIERLVQMVIGSAAHATRGVVRVLFAREQHHLYSGVLGLDALANVVARLLAKGNVYEGN